MKEEEKKDEIINELQKKSNLLEKENPKSITEINFKNISDNPGVYIVYHKNDGIIYIGETKHLKTRLKEHISGERKDTVSSFRRKVSKKYQIEIGELMKNWINDNCSLSWIEINDTDLCKLIEAFLIKYLREDKKLLNNLK